MSVEPRPIRTSSDYDFALGEMRKLWGAESGSRERDRLDVWATLVDHYEAGHFPIDAPDPIEAIRFRMEQQGLTRRDLEPLIGSRGRVAEVLSGKRGLSAAMIRKLAAELDIPAEILLGMPSSDEAA
jgi:HTH-type transcriptional regulator/antitoxin HigA